MSDDLHNIHMLYSNYMDGLRNNAIAVKMLEGSRYGVGDEEPKRAIVVDPNLVYESVADVRTKGSLLNEIVPATLRLFANVPKSALFYPIKYCTHLFLVQLYTHPIHNHTPYLGRLDDVFNTGKNFLRVKYSKESPEPKIDVFRGISLEKTKHEGKYFDLLKCSSLISVGIFAMITGRRCMEEEMTQLSHNPIFSEDLKIVVGMAIKFMDFLKPDLAWVREIDFEAVECCSRAYGMVFNKIDTNPMDVGTHTFDPAYTFCAHDKCMTQDYLIAFHEIVNTSLSMLSFNHRYTMYNTTDVDDFIRWLPMLSLCLSFTSPSRMPRDNTNPAINQLNILTKFRVFSFYFGHRFPVRSNDLNTLRPFFDACFFNFYQSDPKTKNWICLCPVTLFREVIIYIASKNAMGLKMCFAKFIDSL